MPMNGTEIGITKFLHMMSETWLGEEGYEAWEQWNNSRKDSRRKVSFERYCFKTVAKFGFKFVGAGAYRMVVSHPLAPCKVFKVCYDGDGGYSGEWEHYERCTEVEKSYLAPCYYDSGRVTVMKRIRGSLVGNYEKKKRRLTEKERRKSVWGMYYWKCGIYGWGRYPYADSHDYNVIIEKKTGRLILIDYSETL